jgi:PKD repeat protein
VAPINHQPIAGIDDIYTGNEDEAINFDASASTDADGNTLTYNWDFGDSTIQTTSTAIASHVYAEPGTYTLSLTVSDGLLTSAADTAVVTINNVNLAPVATAGSDQTIYLGETITLDGTASTDSDGTIASYYWDLGDGAIQSGATLSYEYLAAGTYTVELEVTDNEGTYSSDFLTVTVNETPKVTNVEVPEKYITTVSVKIKWKKIKTAVQYRVKLMDRSGNKIKIYKVKKKYIYKIIKNLATSTVYKIKVRAKYDDHIFGPWSKSKKITTLAE